MTDIPSYAFGRMFPNRPEWIARTPLEQPLEPDLPIVDTHHHFWDRPNYRYLVHEFQEETDCGHNIEQTVYVECHSMYRADGPEHLRPVGETEFAAGLGAMSCSGAYGPVRMAAAIVSYADLTLGARTEEALEAHMAAGQGHFRGIRHRGTWDADSSLGSLEASAPGLYLRPEFRQGVRALTARGLSLDACVFFHQLQDVASLATACPDANIILDHTGLPLGYGPYAGRGDEVRAIWLENMRQVAACPNVSLKLGGLMIRLAAFDYPNAEAPITSQGLAKLWRPYIEPAVELFGPHRCLFESNFPIDKSGIAYGNLWNCFKRLVAGLSDEDKKALFAGTARRVYRLDDPAP